MRVVLCLILVASCSKKNEPSTDFVSDVTVFCNALDEGPMTGIEMLGPRILPRIKTDEVKRLFDMKQSDPAGALMERLDAAAKRTGQTRCPTLDWMRGGMR